MSSLKKLLLKSAIALLFIITPLTADNDHSAIADSLQEHKKVILISRKNCTACTKAKEFLDTQGIRYMQYDVKGSKKGKRLFKKYKGKGVPMIIIGKEVIHGFDGNAIIKAL